MDESQGKSFAPVIGSIITFLIFGTTVFISLEFLFSIGPGETLKIDSIGFEYPLARLYLIVGIVTSLVAALIVYLILRIRFTLNVVVDEKTEEIIKSRDFFLKLFDESPVPYLMVEADATILLPNKAAQRLFGRTAEELRQLKFYQMNDDAYISESRMMNEKFTRGVPVSDTELQIVKSDGKKRWVRLSALPYHHSGGKSKGGVVALLDITEQKAIDKVKTEFVSLASHQLRTPLSAMKWYGEMVLSGDDGELTPKQRNHIERIYHGNERMIDLVNLLLSASRLELGSLKIDIVNINPVQISREILEELSQLIGEKNLHIIENYSGDADNFYSDEKLLRMIIQNLLSNAAKYTNEEGEIHIKIALTNENMTLEVRDNGLGIPEEQQDLIFSKMFRADNARLQVTDGTGLGLYIVKEAVEALSGEIRFTSKENEGTMFTVVLPNGTHGAIQDSSSQIPSKETASFVGEQRM